MYNDEELDDVVWVALRLVLVCCVVQDPNDTYKFYEEVLMGGNPTVWNICKRFF